MADSHTQADRPRRVLIIKPSALGDVVTALPVLRGLRRSFPNCHISWLLRDTCAPLVAHDSQLDEVVLFERSKLGRAWRSVSAGRALIRLLGALRRGRYDWVIDLQGLLRSGLLSMATRAPVRAGPADASEGGWLFYNQRIELTGEHTVDRNIALARRLGIDARPDDMTLEISPAGEQFVRRVGLPERFLVCVPPTTWPTKLYPVARWREVVAELARRVPVVLAGAPGDVEICRQVADGIDGAMNLAGQTTPDEMVALIAASAGVICCDSAAKFIAPAVGADCVTLIGPTRIERTGPYLKGRAIVADVPCQGCLRKRCSHITCMQMIDPGEVVAAAETMLSKQTV